MSCSIDSRSVRDDVSGTLDGPIEGGGGGAAHLSCRLTLGTMWVLRCEAIEKKENTGNRSYYKHAYEISIAQLPSLATVQPVKNFASPKWKG